VTCQQHAATANDHGVYSAEHHALIYHGVCANCGEAVSAQLGQRWRSTLHIIREEADWTDV
jgi:Fe2+ or Zn2+ uptake regulation protein